MLTNSWHASRTISLITHLEIQLQSWRGIGLQKESIPCFRKALAPYSEVATSDPAHAGLTYSRLLACNFFCNCLPPTNRVSIRNVTEWRVVQRLVV